ncbi:MAG: DUF4139 domain-containing protein [Rhodospirillales bacterium]|nr:MAG: DUF4139 domain-containing protein [Rhodospirillales bacterium]
MFSDFSLKAAALALAAATLAVTTAATAQELQLKRVMLSAGGVGYFEYEAQVEGDVTLPLSVRLDQVDDVLKSIVVYDDSGAAGAIRLAGREPVSQIFRDLPFGPEALKSPVSLLNALPGSQIRATGQRQIEGRLVRVVPESVVLPDGRGATTRHRVSVMTAAGLQTFIFEEADSVIFTDPELRAQIDAALAAISEHRTRDRRTLQVLSRGTDKRTVRVGYVVAAPLWKATYRLTLAGRGDAKARLQGWAVIENMSGQDWRDAELTIVSGNPVTFRQALYSAYYVQRPEVPVEVLGRVMPRADTGAISLDVDELAAANLGYEQEFRKAQRAFPGEGGAVGLADLSDARDAMRASRMAEAMRADEPAAAAQAPLPPPSQARLVAAASKEAATQVTFRIPQPVSVASGQSVLVPIIDRDIPGERIGLYQQSAHDKHPLAAVRLANDGKTGLPAGVITLYETSPDGASYVGDAQLATLPSGDERLVSFALDQKTLIDREVESKQVIARGRIVRGVLELTYEAEQTTVYRIKAPANEARDVLIEHPRQQGWKIVTPDPKEIELTDDQYRVRRTIAAGKEAKLTVQLTRPRVQTIALTGQTRDFYLAYAGNGELSDRLRSALQRMAELRDVVDTHQRRMQQLEEERKRIHEEQRRIRDNLARIPRDSDLHKRYLSKLNVQEDKLETILAETEDAREALDAATAALGDYIRELDI